MLTADVTRTKSATLAAKVVTAYASMATGPCLTHSRNDTPCCVTLAVYYCNRPEQGEPLTVLCKVDGVKRIRKEADKMQAR